jgi:hypothetical protein
LIMASERCHKGSRPMPAKHRFSTQSQFFS